MDIWFVVIGGAWVFVGVALGWWDVQAMRRASDGFLHRARTIYGVTITGSSTLTASDARVLVNGESPPPPTDAERLIALEQKVEEIQATLARLPDDVLRDAREEWTTATDMKDREHRDFVTAVETFARDLDPGYLRRRYAIGCVLYGGVLQAIGAVIASQAR